MRGLPVAGLMNHALNHEQCERLFEKGANMYRGILVAIDGSEYSAKAAKHAALLARMSGARLVLFHVAPHLHVPPYTEGLDISGFQENNEEARSARDVWARRLLASTRKELGFPDLAVEELFVVSDAPYKAILENAQSCECDLIVMAPHGHHGIAGVLLGSETQTVLTHSKLPVLVVR